MDPLKVLTVDDEYLVHDGLDVLIDWNGLGCRHSLKAYNGTDAFNIVQTERPDIIITDMKLPDMEGIELIRSVRTISQYSPAIVVMSGYDNPTYIRTAMRYRAADYLLKPVDENELFRCIKKIVDARARVGIEADFNRSVRQAAVGTFFRGLVVGGYIPSPEVLEWSGLDRAEPPLAFGLIVPFSSGGGENPEKCRLSSDFIQSVLNSTEVKDISECVYQEDNGPTGFLLTKTSPRESLLGIKGFYKTLSPKLPYPIKLLIGKPVSSIAGIGVSRKSIFDYAAARHSIDAPGFLVIPDSGPDGTGKTITRNDISTLTGHIDKNIWPDTDKYIHSFFHDIAKGGISSTVLREWIGILIFEVQSLLLSLKGEEPGSIANLHSIIRNLEFTPMNDIKTAVSGYMRDVSQTIDSLRLSVRHQGVVLACRSVERRCSERITLRELAAELSTDPGYLGRLFKKVTGKSFKEYQRRLRMWEARRLLRESNMRVADIATKVGYSNYDYFVEQFKREMNATPSMFRRL